MSKQAGHNVAARRPKRSISIGHFPDERGPLQPPSLGTALVVSKARVISTLWAAESTALTPATGFWDLSEGIPA